MFSLEGDPQVCKVTGDQIRDLIDIHVRQGMEALISYRAALADGVVGVDWECAIDTLSERVKTAMAVRPAIGDGPFSMSVGQWIQLCNRWPPVLDAKGVVTEQARRAAHNASHRASEAAPDRAS